MQVLLGFLLRLVLLAAGLVIAASLALAAVILAALWGLRAAWCKLTGKPIIPFVVRIDPRGGFDRMYRRPEEASPTPRADAVSGERRGIGDVTDVQAKE